MKQRSFSLLVNQRIHRIAGCRAPLTFTRKKNSKKMKNLLKFLGLSNVFLKSDPAQAGEKLEGKVKGNSAQGEKKGVGDV